MADKAQTAERPSALARIEKSTPQAKLAQFRGAGYDKYRLAMIWEQVAPTLSMGEFLFFMDRCAITGLDPQRNQIVPVKRRDSSAPSGFKVTHQVTIDGFRAQAASSGAYAGSDPPEWSEPTTWKKKPAHEVCRVTVYRMVQGQRVPFTGECRLSEYYPGDKLGGMWERYPHNQIAKCTEAQALRKAFPVELGGLSVDGDPGNDELEAQFADTVLQRSDGEPEYLERVDKDTGAVTQVRAGDEYQRLYPDDDAPLEASFRAVEEASETATEAPKAEASDPAPWEKPQPKMRQSQAVAPKDTREVEARAKAGLCTHPECVEAHTQNKAAAETDPPRCLNHVNG